MISPWKWVQIPHQLYRVRAKELNGIRSLSVVTYNVILCHCNSPGTPGAADIVRAGDWSSDWSRLHRGPRRGCSTRTQGAGPAVYPLTPTRFRKKNPFCLFSILWSDSFLRHLSHTRSLRWPSWPVTLNHSLWPRWAWPLSCTTTSSRWTSWTRPRPCRSLPYRCSMLPRKAEETQRCQTAHIATVCLAYHDLFSQVWPLIVSYISAGQAENQTICYCWAWRIFSCLGLCNSLLYALLSVVSHSLVLNSYRTKPREFSPGFMAFH